MQCQWIYWDNSRCDEPPRPGHKVCDNHAGRPANDKKESGRVVTN